MHDCLVVKNGSERTPVSTDAEGLKRLVEIHGAVNILNFDGSPYLLAVPAVVPETVESVPEAIDDEDKPKRKSR